MIPAPRSLGHVSSAFVIRQGRVPLSARSPAYGRIEQCHIMLHMNMEHIRPILDRVVAEKRPSEIPTASAVLDDGRLLEMVVDPLRDETRFVVGDASAWQFVPELHRPDMTVLVPYSPRNNLLRHKVVLFPSGPEEYGSDAALVTSIQAFIHRWVDVSPLFEKLAASYVLLSWVAESFHELPYLRVRGEPGTGKTRFLQTIGAIANKPIFASGASSVASLFRILDAFRGTLLIDESDFRMSDEKAEIVKILNNGNVRGFPILRAEANRHTKEFNPRAYDVFGPKILASRGFFDDKALESRFLSEEMGAGHLREDIAINLPGTHALEALHLRNQLLLFRLRNFQKPRSLEALVDRSIEPRLNQVLVPLLSIIEDPDARADLQELARELHRQMVGDRGLELEGQILDVICGIARESGATLAIRDITTAFLARHALDYPHLTPKKIGWVIRKKLGLTTDRTRDGYVIASSESAKLERLYQRYGLSVAPATSGLHNVPVEDAPGVDNPGSEAASSDVDNPNESRMVDHQIW